MHCYYNHRTVAQEAAQRSIYPRVFWEDGEKEVIPRDDGWLLWTTQEDRMKFRLSVSVPRSPSVRVFVVDDKDPNKGIKVKKWDKTPEAPLATYEKEVVCLLLEQELPDENFATKHLNNNLRVLVTQNNRFEIWEIAIVTLIRKGQADFFLTIQLTYSARLFNSNGRLAALKSEYRNFNKWADLHKLIAETVEVAKLEPLPAKEAEACTNHLLPFQGKVIFFNLANMWGFAETTEGQALLHWRQVNNDGESLPAPQTGDVFSFERFEFDVAGRKRIIEAELAVAEGLSRG